MVNVYCALVAIQIPNIAEFVSNCCLFAAIQMLVISGEILLRNGWPMFEVVAIHMPKEFRNKGRFGMVKNYWLFFFIATILPRQHMVIVLVYCNLVCLTMDICNCALILITILYF